MLEVASSHDALPKIPAPRNFFAKKRLRPDRRMISAFHLPMMWYAPSCRGSIAIALSASSRMIAARRMRSFFPMVREARPIAAASAK